MKNFKVLIVDDDEFNQEILALNLEIYNLDTVIVDNGKKALNFIKNEHGIDLIFMDINMPVMNGLDATKAIRDYEISSGIKKVPIVAAGASIEAEEQAEILACGMDDAITKPLREEDLKRVLNSYLFESKVFTYDIDAAKKSLMISEEMIIDFVHKLSSSLDDELLMLQEMAQKKDYTSLRDLSHKLKGRSGNLQVMQMYDIFSEIEKNAKESKECDYISLINEISELNLELKKL